ncbi:hypothetical protein TeGR_g7794 [Tetraparma gracilis]|uniref:Lecithin:cholesterol acyltransferase-domain-containing protein n=1 Tax=Tetraparma gracilis TaxID=2962635 RepID=A0ABQ6MUL7_9STRA|nr:hypothetical protein TeGR_g7794 [Tetraparma gracilis]
MRRRRSCSADPAPRQRDSSMRSSMGSLILLFLLLPIPSLPATTSSRIAHEDRSDDSIYLGSLSSKPLSSQPPSPASPTPPSSSPPSATLPPVYLIPGLAATQLSTSGNSSTCPSVPPGSLMWLSVSPLLPFAPSKPCWKHCLSLGPLEADRDCPVRARDTGALESISSLSPSPPLHFALGATNDLYATLINVLTTDLKYSPDLIRSGGYDWRLSIRRMQERDGYYDALRASLESESAPAVIVAHSMGNLVFRGFTEWLWWGFYEEARLELSPEGGDEADDATLSRYLPEFLASLLPPLPPLPPLPSFLSDLLPSSVLSGENMGLPISEKESREIELTFGSTVTASPVPRAAGKKWRCSSQPGGGVLANLRRQVEGRTEWDTNFPLVTLVTNPSPLLTTTKPRIVRKSSPPPGSQRLHSFGPAGISSGAILSGFASHSSEPAPLLSKLAQTLRACHDPEVPWTHLLNRTWARPPIQNIVIVYGVDVPTEVGYVYSEQQLDPLPKLEEVLWENAGGEITVEVLGAGGWTRKPKTRPLRVDPNLAWTRSGDGTVPYMSLSHAFTWLADDSSEELDVGTISVSVKHATSARFGSLAESPDDTCFENDIAGVGQCLDEETHMERFSSRVQADNGVVLSTAVIEARGVEHKEITRNLSLLRLAFREIFGAR